MSNQARSWPPDTGRMDLRLALGSIPVYFVSPLPNIHQSYPLTARGFLCTSTTEEVLWPQNYQFIMYNEGPIFTENYFR